MKLNEVRFDNGIIEKHDNYAILVFPNGVKTCERNYNNIKCIVRIKDIKQLKKIMSDENLRIRFSYTFKKQIHKLCYFRGDRNTSSDYSIISLILNHKTSARTPNPFKQDKDALWFDLRPILNMLEK